MEGFGVFQVPEAECREVVLNAIRTGYRLIDTASSYKNEEAVGEAIRQAVAEGTVKREEPEGWAPFAEGLKGMFTEPFLQKIAAKHGKTAAQVILRWNIQQGVVIIPKSVHKERMEENMAIWDFVLDDDDMERITALDKNCPSMLDCSKPGEIDRLYDYLNNPVLTTLNEES